MYESSNETVGFRWIYKKNRELYIFIHISFTNEDCAI